ncbi:unnamed protein product [Rotaria sordida]|uniref:NAD(P)(+)--arginine ADP-ribosyltransferase n=1 Tax=Rotaria sordida TaxID=392033 RepID=A0A814QV55_9BILA|nr:unnamed protein product [Rotaria sordida]CAF1125044.1 unnamed protein product [Rotaria sordida]
MYRFTDVESTPKRLTSVYGYLAHELLPLQKALEPISSQINQLDRFSKIAKNECHFPSEHGLTRDESAAIFLYTMEWGKNSLYQVMNRALRAEDRSSLKPWFGYLKLFDTAVQKLPIVRKNLWRGVATDIAKNFKKGDEFTWWTISSCSTSVNMIKDFLGSSSTLFLIEAVNGKDISRYTNYSSESEVILCPGTRLRVISDPLDQPYMHIVHLQENNDEGELKEGKKHGKGTMNYANNDKYSGDWVDDVRTGQGVYVYAGGSHYEGQYKDNKKHGKGTFVWGSDTKCAGDKYTGDWVDGVRTGQGVYVDGSGSRYEGQYKDNKKHGKGTFVWGPDTKYADDKYTGDWVDDVRTGQGVYVYVGGSHYEGQYKYNKEHGKGTLVWGPDTKWAGDKYTGDWVDGVRAGQGVYVYANEQFSGQYKDNKEHGKGTFVWGPDTKWAGDKYTGDWVDGVRAGQGVYVYANGNRYEGQFKDGKLHGRGKMKYANGTIKEGMWSNNTFVG